MLVLTLQCSFMWDIGIWYSRRERFISLSVFSFFFFSAQISQINWIFRPNEFSLHQSLIHIKSISLLSILPLTYNKIGATNKSNDKNINNIYTQQKAQQYYLYIQFCFSLLCCYNGTWAVYYNYHTIEQR